VKIKTICYGLDNTGLVAFDKDVNDALADGYRLIKREVLPGVRYTDTRWGNRCLYAELVKLDPPAEPETPDPLDLLRQVREACLQVPSNGCNREGCPMFDWCEQLRKGGDPTDWVLPGEVQP
jgi:hypothetical protein